MSPLLKALAPAGLATFFIDAELRARISFLMQSDKSTESDPGEKLFKATSSKVRELHNQSKKLRRARDRRAFFAALKLKNL